MENYEPIRCNRHRRKPGNRQGYLAFESIRHHLAVREMPGSGSGKELLAWAGIDANHIAAAARRLLGK
jgi:hypothetical protein